MNFNETLTYFFGISNIWLWRWFHPQVQKLVILLTIPKLTFDVIHGNNSCDKYLFYKKINLGLAIESNMNSSCKKLGLRYFIQQNIIFKENDYCKSFQRTLY